MLEYSGKAIEKTEDMEPLSSQSEPGRDFEASSGSTFQWDVPGKAATVLMDYDLVDRFDNGTGFSALERVTGIGASTASTLQVASKMRPGAEPPELALPYRDYLPQLKRRGLRIVESQRALAAAT